MNQTLRRFSMERRHAIGLGASMAAASLAAQVIRPTKLAASSGLRINLKDQIPLQFGEFKSDAAFDPYVTIPEVQSKLKALYDQTLSRTYEHQSGQRVMLCIAYGTDQSSESTQVHRPEVCYGAQGFKVQFLRDEPLDLASHRIVIRRLLTQLGARYEPVSYWVTLGSSATLPGLQRRLQQLRLGLQGWVTDGLLMRVSTVELNLDASLALQDRFLQQLETAVPAAVRSRYFGT
jgi:EpsI family protein